MCAWQLLWWKFWSTWQQWGYFWRRRQLWFCFGSVSNWKPGSIFPRATRSWIRTSRPLFHGHRRRFKEKNKNRASKGYNRVDWQARAIRQASDSFYPTPTKKWAKCKTDGCAMHLIHLISSWSFAAAKLFRVLDIAHEALVDNTPITKRDMYYCDPNLFQTQLVVDKVSFDGFLYLCFCSEFLPAACRWHCRNIWLDSVGFEYRRMPLVGMN